MSVILCRIRAESHWQKLGNLVQSQAMPHPPHPLAHVRELLGVTHYHQARGRHPGPRFIPAERECIELVTGGRGWVLHEGNWVEVLPGTLVWQAEGDQTIGRSDFDDPYRCLAVNVAVERARARRVPRLTRWDDVEDARWFTREAVRWAMDDAVDRGAVLAWIYGRLLFQASLSVRQERAALSPQLRAVQEALDTRYAEPLRLAELARRIGWSEAHLHAMFRARLGTSPHQYLIQRRLRAARELLAATRQPIGDVAVACGFADAAAFCRAFRRAMRTTPAAYRRAHAA
jgi:AraC-like DNA-binding protein